MKPHRMKHSDEDLADLLASSNDASSDAELLAMKSALASYRTETLQWAERRSATQPSLVPAARRNRMWAAVPQWSLASIAVITIAASVVHLAGDTAADTAPDEASAVVKISEQARSTAEQIAADNRLLSSIDDALSYHNDAPVAELGLKPDVRSNHAEKAASEVF